jgi:hypothetical protein
MHFVQFIFSFATPAARPPAPPPARRRANCLPFATHREARLRGFLTCGGLKSNPLLAAKPKRADRVADTPIDLRL